MLTRSWGRSDGNVNIAPLLMLDGDSMCCNREVNTNKQAFQSRSSPSESLRSASATCICGLPKTEASRSTIRSRNQCIPVSVLDIQIYLPLRSCNSCKISESWSTSLAFWDASFSVYFILKVNGMGAELFPIALTSPLAFISPINWLLFGRGHWHLVCTNDI